MSCMAYFSYILIITAPRNSVVATAIRGRGILYKNELQTVCAINKIWRLSGLYKILKTDRELKAMAIKASLVIGLFLILQVVSISNAAHFDYGK